MNLAIDYINTTRKIFQLYKEMGDAVLVRLSEDELHFVPDTTANSIAVLVKHMNGNMLSRFTDFLHSDGEKEWRDRDGEFEDTLQSKEEIQKAWKEGWDCLFNAIDQISEEQLATHMVTIREEPHSIIAALNRQLAHYANHVGQMVYIAKALKKEAWQSLSIPKGQSKGWKKPFLK